MADYYMPGMAGIEFVCNLLHNYQEALMLSYGRF